MKETMNSNIDTYLKKRSEKGIWKLNSLPKKSIYEFIICIPAYAEKDYILNTLNSIGDQDKILLDRTMTIIVINNGNNRTDQVFQNNEKTEQYIQSYSTNFEILIVDAFSKGNELPEKFAGVGLARKIGFDLALPFSSNSTIFCNLDSDTLVSKKYLSAINHFFYNTKKIAAVTEFSHQVGKNKSQNDAIKLYENFIRNTSKKLLECKSPYYYHAIGSTIICRADAYSAVGGMPKKKATEDFYFLEALAKYKSVDVIKNKLVFTSCRYSNRVYLGTGYRMNQSKDGFDLSKLYFSDESFAILRNWLELGLQSNNLSYMDLISRCSTIHYDLPKFLLNEKINIIWEGLKKSSPTINHFESQFHRWFDALKTIRLLKYFS